MNVAEDLAQALSMNCAFITEFEEVFNSSSCIQLHPLFHSSTSILLQYESAIRPPSNQGGGVHGNAILTKYDFRHVCPIIHSEQSLLFSFLFSLSYL